MITIRFATRGQYGESMIARVTRVAWQYNVLRGFNEAIALQYILPLRVRDVDD